MPGRLTFSRRGADAEAIMLRHGQTGHPQHLARTDKRKLNPKNTGNHVVDYTSVQDLAELEEITLENVLVCLVERYKAGHFYTFAGSVLISLNPIASLGRKSLPSFDNLGLFRNDEIGQCPSVTSVGEKCLAKLSSVGIDQVVVVSGDSGAGKTTVTQQLLCYFIDKSCRTATPNSLDKKIYFATIILESLGNASTAGNLNSSRFGRFIQLNYDAGSGSLLGARIRTCLLEKHRVAKFEKAERNFHIFYYILAGLQTGVLKMSEIRNENATGYSSWESHIPIYFVVGVVEADALQFQSLLRAFQALKLTQELHTVFRVIYGIMMLISISFVPIRDDDDSPSDESSEYVPENEESIRVIGDLFSVDPKILSNILVSRTITVSGTRGKRQSIFRKPCNSVAECEARTSVIASALYDALFSYILRRLNSLFKMRPENDSVYGADTSNTLNMISLLDLYGFESLTTNGLEQLCINYANERLQLVHLQNMKSYASEFENYAPTELNKVESESLKRLKSIHETIFTVLDEACLLNRKVSEFDTYERIKNLTGRDQFIEAKSVQHSNCQFIIKHYASEVKYSFAGMVDKNSDNIPPEFQELFTSSTNPSIRLLFSDVEERDATNNPRCGNKREKTILQRFKASVDELATELANEDQDVHFIRCIRPSDKTAISVEVIKRQLFSTGVVDIIRITGDGFPIRLLQSKFASMFPALRIRFLSSESESDGVALSKMFRITEDEFRIGRKQFFFTEGMFEFLKKLEAFLVHRSVKKIQKCWNLWQTRKLQRNSDHEENSTFVDAGESFLVESGAGDILFGEDSLSQVASASWNQLHSQGDSELVSGRKTGSSARLGIKSTGSVQYFYAPRKASEEETKLIMENLNLRRRDGILTRGQLYEFPVRFHLRKTLLPFSHRCPKTQGLGELLNEI